MRCKVLACTVLALATGCSDKDVGKIKRVTKVSWGKVQQPVLAASAEARQGIQDVEGMLGKVEPPGSPDPDVARYEDLFRSDPGLRGASIRVAKTGKGYALNGSVVDKYQFDRAGALGRTWMGKDKVRNNLRITGKK